MILKEIYNLKEDLNRIKFIQEASSDKNSFAGYKTENGLLFGTSEWFNAIETGIIPKQTIKGNISRIIMSGHNDFPEFEIKTKTEISIWEKKGVDEEYEIGKYVELTYVKQKYKKPTSLLGAVSKCIIKIKIC